MSALSKLVGKPQPWHWFSAKYPVKVKQLNSTNLFKEQTKKHILEAGDALQGRNLMEVQMMFLFT